MSESIADITESAPSANDVSNLHTPGYMHTPGSIPGDSPKKLKIIESRVKSFRSNANME